MSSPRFHDIEWNGNHQRGLAIFKAGPVRNVALETLVSENDHTGIAVSPAFNGLEHLASAGKLLHGSLLKGALRTKVDIHRLGIHSQPFHAHLPGPLKFLEYVLKGFGGK